MQIVGRSLTEYLQFVFPLIRKAAYEIVSDIQQPVIHRLLCFRRPQIFKNCPDFKQKRRKVHESDSAFDPSGAAPMGHLAGFP